MKIITVYNRKGGVAKTSTVEAMAYYLTEKKNKRVLLIDLDGQCDLTRQLNKSTRKPSAYEIITGTATIPDSVRVVKKDTDENGNVTIKMALIPASDELDQIDTFLANDDFGFKRLKDAIEACPNLSNLFDYIIIDTPPSRSKIYVNALTVSDYVLIPAKAEEASSEAVRNLKKSIDSVVKGSNPKLKVAGILLTQVKLVGGKPTKVFQENKRILKELAENEYHCKLFSAFTSLWVSLTEAQQKKMSFFEYSPNSGIVKEYCAFMEEFLEVIGE